MTSLAHRKRHRDNVRAWRKRKRDEAWRKEVLPAVFQNPYQSCLDAYRWRLVMPDRNYRFSLHWKPFSEMSLSLGFPEIIVVNR